jgi:hypothetical protein
VLWCDIDCACSLGVHAAWVGVPLCLYECFEVGRDGNIVAYEYAVHR